MNLSITYPAILDLMFIITPGVIVIMIGIYYLQKSSMEMVRKMEHDSYIRARQSRLDLLRKLNGGDE